MTEFFFLFLPFFQFVSVIFLYLRLGLLHVQSLLGFVVLQIGKGFRHLQTVTGYILFSRFQITFLSRDFNRRVVTLFFLLF